MIKKIVATTFCTLLLCSLILITLGPTIAVAQDYTRTSYYTQVIPTIDGKWTTPDEWTDGEETWIGTDVVFRSTWDEGRTRWIVEFLTDTTDDPGDMWRFCIDSTPGDATETYYKWEITGHDEIEWFLLVNAWTTMGGTGVDMQWDNSFSSSPTDSTPHWILEFQMTTDSGSYPFDSVWNFLLEVNDASNPEFIAWPPTNPDEPATWGEENRSPEPIAEGLTFAIMALLTTVSMLVGYKYFVKRK